MWSHEFDQFSIVMSAIKLQQYSQKLNLRTFLKRSPLISRLSFIEKTPKNNLFVDLTGVGEFAIDGCAVQRWDRHGLHGDKLDFVGESPACICAARHSINMFKDGG